MCRRASADMRMSRLPGMAVVAPPGDNYGNKSLLNVDGNYYSKSKRKRSQFINNRSHGLVVMAMEFHTPASSLRFMLSRTLSVA